MDSCVYLCVYKMSEYLGDFGEHSNDSHIPNGVRGDSSLQCSSM